MGVQKLLAGNDALIAHEHECGLEYAEELIRSFIGKEGYEDAHELLALIEEMLNFKKECGNEKWQSVMEFEQKHMQDWLHHIRQGNMSVLMSDFEQRFDPVYEFMRRSHIDPSGIDAFDIDKSVHEQSHTVAEAIRHLVDDANVPLAGGDAREAVVTSTSKIYASGKASYYESFIPVVEGITVASTMPDTDETGNILEGQRIAIGNVITLGSSFDTKKQIA